jgi:hypothetical protein
MKTYSVKIWREIQGANKIIKFGPFPTLKDADVIARHEAHEPKTKKVQAILAPNEVKREYQGGEFYKGNPATRKGTTKVYRKSQVTKKPPTKRLVARRKTNVKKGYFPNPSKKYPFEVQFMVHTGGGEDREKWATILATHSELYALDLANMLAKHPSYGNQRIRVVKL